MIKNVYFVEIYDMKASTLIPFMMLNELIYAASTFIINENVILVHICHTFGDNTENKYKHR